MGDLSDMHDLCRFIRSTEGKIHLESIKNRLLTGRITDVTFTNDIFGITMTLHFNDGGTLIVLDLSLQIEVLRDEFPEVLEREYYKDYPERKPKET